MNDECIHLYLCLQHCICLYNDGLYVCVCMYLIMPHFAWSLQNYTVTDMVTKIAGEFKTKPIEGMLSHQLKQNIINGEKTIIQNPNEGQRKEHDKCDFEKHEVYGLDVLISTGEGTVRDGGLDVLPVRPGRSDLHRRGNGT